MATDVSQIQVSSTAFGDRTHASQSVVQTHTDSQNSAAANAPQHASVQTDLAQALAQLQEFAKSMHRNLSFSVDSETGDSIVKVMDAETQEVVRQIPSEEALNIAHNLQQIKGILFEKKA